MALKTLGERLTYARKSKRITQVSLAERIGVSRGVVYNIEKNLTSPQPIVLTAICHTLGVNLDWLLTGEGDMDNALNLPYSSEPHRELLEAAADLSENELRFLIDMIKALKNRFSGLR